jgi:uncharacterized membrane protein
MADQQTDLAIVIEAINKASSTLKQVEKDLGGLTQAVEQDGDAATTASLGFGQLVAGVATGTVVANIATSAFQKLGSILLDIPRTIFDIAQSASEVEGLAVAMHVVANNAGLTADQVDKVRDSVVDQNITTEAANRLMTDLIRNQLDYTQATELATAAQNIAVASGVSSSETLERISEAIASGNTWNLRQLGLVEHLDNVYETYGETLGKTSDEMTEMDRKQSIVNYVLQEGIKYSGSYDKAMENAAKKMRSTEDRTKQIAYLLGRVFGPALNDVTNKVYKFVDGIIDWANAHKEQLTEASKQILLWVKKVQLAVGAVLNALKSVLIGIGVVVTAFTTLKVATALYGMVVAGTLIPTIVAAILKFQALAAAAWTAAAGVIAAMGPAGWIAAAAALGGLIAAITTDFMGMTTSMKKAWSGFQDMFKLDIEDISLDQWKDDLKELNVDIDKLTPKQRDALKKMLKDIEKENRDYQQAVEKRARDFEESFEDLVISHRDKIQELTDDLADESVDYNEKLQDLLEDYNEAMYDIEKRHEEKTKSVMEDMEEERKKAEEEIKKITKAYNEEVSLIKKEGEDRVGNLQAQLDKEKALGDNANKEKIEALEQMIAYEQSGLATALDEKKANYDEEVATVNESLNEKLEKIKKELAEEDAAYADSYAKRKKQYEDDVTDAKASYEEKREALQKELDTELAIRERYAEDFARIGDKIAEDDITRLVRKYNEEKAEMEREHQEKLTEIENNAFEQGLALTENLAAGIDAGHPQVQSRLNQMTSDLNRAIGKIDELNTKIESTGQLGDYYTPSNYPGGNYPYYGQAGGIFSKPTIVGEAGAEVVLPLSFPKRMAQIMQLMGIKSEGSGGQVTQNFYVTVNSSQDVDILMERAGFAMKQGGGYS